MPTVMLGGRIHGGALALVALLSLAQTGGADPRGDEADPDPKDVSPLPKPRPVPTLKEKQELLTWCSKPANRQDARCKGVAVPPEPDEPGSG